MLPSVRMILRWSGQANNSQQRKSPDWRPPVKILNNKKKTNCFSFSTHCAHCVIWLPVMNSGECLWKTPHDRQLLIWAIHSIFTRVSLSCFKLMSSGVKTIRPLVHCTCTVWQAGTPWASPNVSSRFVLLRLLAVSSSRSDQAPAPASGSTLPWSWWNPSWWRCSPATPFVRTRAWRWTASQWPTTSASSL